MSNKKSWIFLLSVFIYSVGHLLTRSYGSIGYVIAAFSAIVFYFALFTSTQINKYDICINNIVKILIIYVCISLLITFQWSYFGIRQIFLDTYLFFPYLCIITTTRKFSSDSIKVIIKILALSGVFFIVYSLMNLTEVLTINPNAATEFLLERNLSFDIISKRFCTDVGFLLLLLPYLNKKYSIIAIIALAINLAIAIYMGRRNIIFTNGLFVIFSMIFYIKYSKIKRFTKLLLAISIMSIGVFISINMLSFLETNDLMFFSRLSDRFNADTRSAVTDAFYRDMNDNPIQWLFGKGIVSEYYCPGVQDGTIFRSVIETGWQHIIFKIGGLGLTLMGVILFVALKRPRTNILISACWAYILIGILEMFPAGVPAFDLRFVLIWIFVSICNDPNFCNLSNDEVKRLIRA